MKKISRRSFVKTTAVTAASLSLFGLAGCKKTEQKPAATQDAAAPVAEGAKTGHTVVIAGGGYGGATTAKYLPIINSLFFIGKVRRVSNVPRSFSPAVTSIAG